MAKLTIIREKSVFLEKLDFSIFLDGQKIGAVSNGSSGDFDVQPGNYKMTCETGWQNKSKDYQLATLGSENKSVIVKPAFLPNILRIAFVVLFAVSFFEIKFSQISTDRNFYFAIFFCFVLLVLIPLRKYFIEIKDVK